MAYPDKGRHGVRGAPFRRSAQIGSLCHRGVRGALQRSRVVRPWLRFSLCPGSCDRPQLTGRARRARSGRVEPRKEIAAGLAGAGTATLARSPSRRRRESRDGRGGEADRGWRERQGFAGTSRRHATEAQGCGSHELRGAVGSARRVDARRAGSDRHRPGPSCDGADHAGAVSTAAERAGSGAAGPFASLS